MDDAVDTTAELAENLHDLERANRWFGGSALVDAVLQTAAATVLDVGCGSADIPAALAARAHARGRALRVTCLDRSAQILAVARSRVGSDPGLEFVQANGEALPFGDGAFDVVTCSLALHHFDPPAALRLLSEMRRVARLRPFVSDLVRSLSAYVGTLAFVHLLSRNRLTRHDGPLSVRRAYTPGEARALAARAGWRSPRVRRTPFFRMLLYDD